MISPALEADTKTPPCPPLGGGVVIERVGRHGREIRIEFESVGGGADTSGRCLCR